MPRIGRLKIKGEEAVYHVMSRTALDGFVLGDVEKEFLLKLTKRLSRIYFAEVLGFCSEYIKEVKQGFSRFYNKRHGRKGFFWSERFTLLNSMRSFGDILCLCATE